MTYIGAQKAAKAAAQQQPGQEGKAGAKRKRKGQGSQAHDAQQPPQAAVEGGKQHRKAPKHEVCARATG